MKVQTDINMLAEGFTSSKYNVRINLDRTGEDVRKHIEESMNGHVSKPIAPQAPCARLSETIAKKHLDPS